MKKTVEIISEPDDVALERVEFIMGGLSPKQDIIKAVWTTIVAIHLDDDLARIEGCPQCWHGRVFAREHPDGHLSRECDKTIPGGWKVSCSLCSASARPAGTEERAWEHWWNLTRRDRPTTDKGDGSLTIKLR